MRSAQWSMISTGARTKSSSICSSVSEIDRRSWGPTAGGAPARSRGLWSPHGAGMRKTTRSCRSTSSPPTTCKTGDYIDVFWQLCSYRDHLWRSPPRYRASRSSGNKKLSVMRASIPTSRRSRSLNSNELFARDSKNATPMAALRPSAFSRMEPDWY